MTSSTVFEKYAYPPKCWDFTVRCEFFTALFVSAHDFCARINVTLSKQFKQFATVTKNTVSNSNAHNNSRAIEKWKFELFDGKHCGCKRLTFQENVNSDKTKWEKKENEMKIEIERAEGSVATQNNIDSTRGNGLWKPYYLFALIERSDTSVLGKILYSRFSIYLSLL